MDPVAVRLDAALTRVAAIDCGTNTMRLLIADVHPDTGRQIDHERHMHVVRLGEGVDRTGRISAAALGRAQSVLEQFARLMSDHHVTRVRVAATSALRDASNREEFTALAKEFIGVSPEILSGDEEGSLAFLGATRDLPQDLSPPFLVVDIGGGSTELTFGEVAAAAQTRSVDVGSVRLTERWFDSDLPTLAQVESATTDVDQALADIPRGWLASPTAIGVAGSITTVAALSLGLTSYEPDILHHSRITAANIADVSSWLLRSTHAERAERGAIHPGRVDVIAAGALILRRVVAAVGGREMIVSERDILDGLVWELVS